LSQFPASRRGGVFGGGAAAFYPLIDAFLLDIGP